MNKFSTISTLIIFSGLFPLLSYWSSKSNNQFYYYDTDKVNPFQNNTVTYENMKKSGTKDVFLKSIEKKFNQKFTWTFSPNNRFFFDLYACDKNTFKKGHVLKGGFLSLYKIFN